VDNTVTFDVVLAGSSATSVHELLRSARFEHLLHEASRTYDFVILDTPPLVPVSDAAVVARVVDGMLVVVAAHATPRKLLETALNLIDEPKVLGIVFNGVRSPLLDQYDGYYYKHA
jgi:Mrp family chromosome partitioning ATPase